MNILITGATGFIGSNFLRIIKSENLFADDKIILLTSRELSGYKCILHKDYTFTKEDFIRQGIDNIDIVFHLGSSVPKKNSEFGIEHAYKYAMNVRNTMHLLENIPGLLKKMIFTGTVSVYKNEGIAINENSPFQTDDMYGASKIMCEKYLEAKAQENKFILQILRLGQIYGPGEEVYSKIVSGFMKLIINNQPVTVFGDGSDVRSMLYVDDCCRCIAKSVWFDKYIEPVNVASSQTITVKNLLDLMYSICNMKPNIKYGTNKRPDSNIYDNAKMKEYFDIKEISIEQGIRMFYDYYKNKAE